MLTVAGFQVPVIPLSDVVGKTGAVAPTQMLAVVPKLNVGVRFGLTVTVNVVGTAHWPAVGVKVYVPEFWLSTTAGFQVPVILLVDVVVSVGTVPLTQIVRVVPKGNEGVRFGLTVTVKVAGSAH